MRSRRDLFRHALADLVRAAAAPPPVAERPAEECPAPFLRPPGALAEEAFLAACTRCDACIVACPRDALRHADPSFGPAVLGTPVIVPGEAPCWLCRDLPCIAVCEPKALTPLTAPEDARMGRIRIRLDACYAAQGSICDACVERCPTRPKALRIARGVGPEVDLDRCTGCAVCAWLCPPRAIDVLPA